MITTLAIATLAFAQEAPAPAGPLRLSCPGTMIVSEESTGYASGGAVSLSTAVRTPTTLVVELTENAGTLTMAGTKRKLEEVARTDQLISGAYRRLIYKYRLEINRLTGEATIRGGLLGLTAVVFHGTCEKVDIATRPKF